MDTIKEQFNQVISYSQNIKIINSDHLFNQWKKNKDWFLDHTGGELIYEYPEKVSFSLSTNERIVKIEQFVAKIRYDYLNDALADFIFAMKDCFFNNITTIDYYIPEQDKIIRKGIKIVRAFKYFVKDKNIRTILQNEASRIIQEDKISGTLCISIHPLDFLSSSENNHNWRSCHALDGDYRAGNLSYMADSSTVMIYLRSDNMMKLPNFPSSVPWNSKKWRVLLFFSNDKKMLFLGRQYPFFAEGAPEFILEKLLPQLGWYGWTPWTTTTIDNVIIDGYTHYLKNSYIPVGGHLLQLNELIQDGEDALNFNDLLRSSCYKPMYSYRMLSDTLSSHYGTYKTRFIIGAPVNCLRCGQNHVICSSTVLCSDCEEKYGHLDNDDYGYCICCDRHFYLDTGLLLDDGWVCSECADTQLETCSLCGSLHLRKDMVQTASGEYICRYCQVNIMRNIRTLTF